MLHRIKQSNIVFYIPQQLSGFLSEGVAMIKVTFYVYSKILNKEFRNIELHKSMADANLRALALNWQIELVEAI